MAEVLRLVPAPDRTVLAARRVSVETPSRVLLRRADLEVRRGEVLAIIGPSGAGKSTLLKVLNRLAELETPPLVVEGEVELEGVSVFGSGVDPDELRRRVGILFQQPVVFPRSIRANTLFGAVHHERLDRHQKEQRLEEALKGAALWDEVKDRLDERATVLSVGQQQRLCLARTLAVHPEVILMDEPTSALDPRSTEAIEALIRELSATRPIVLVTHDLAQARRTADVIACICLRDGAGEVVETACCTDFFTRPGCRETVEYLQQGI